MIELVNDEKVWTERLAAFEQASFLHSWAWAEFQQAQGSQVWRWIGSQENNFSLCLGIGIKAKRANFLLVPHGPLVAENKDLGKQQMLEWIAFLKGFCQQHKFHFLRIQPIIPNTQTNQKSFQKIGFRQAPIHMHTDYTSVLDLNRLESDILSKMRKTTRQMIKKAQKLDSKGELEVLYPEEIDSDMHSVYHQTAIRGGFVPFWDEYLNQEYEAFAKYNQAKLIKINYAGKCLSWGLLIFNNRKAFYHQGGNILDKKVPSSYYLHWLGIQEAKRRGCLSYDFWGVSPLDKPNHPWQNISFFKRGFGGRDVDYLKAQDMVLSWRYWIAWVIESIRAKKRGF